MDNLNNIPKSGSYGAGVDLHNDNYQKIGVELQTLRELGQNDKGYFETIADLEAKYPTPQSGWRAYVANVASSTGYYLANVNSSGNWVVTAAEAPPINVDLAGYAKTGGSTKTVKEVEGEIVQLAGEVEQLAYVKIKNEAVNGNLENGLISPFSNTDGSGGVSTLTINSSTPISGNYDIRLTITTPATTPGRPLFNGLNKSANIGDKIYLQFYAKILSGAPLIHTIHNGETSTTVYSGYVINGRNTRVIDVVGTGSALGLIYFNSLSAWDMQMDNFMRINLTETFGAGNEPTKEEMDLLFSTLGTDYFEGEITIPAQKIMQWQQQTLSEYAKETETLDKLIKGWVISESMAISNPIYRADGNISSAVITWGDGDVGSISNVEVSSNGITSIRYNRSNGDYATMSVVYDSKGDFQSQEVIISKA